MLFLGVPPKILGDFNYYDQKIPTWGLIPPKHSDFSNETSKFLLLIFLSKIIVVPRSFYFVHRSCNQFIDLWLVLERVCIFSHPSKSLSFAVVQVGSCGQTGRFGPTPEQCAEFHNNTSVEVLSSSSSDEGDATLRSKGIQRWIAPRGGYYT